MVAKPIAVILKTKLAITAMTMLTHLDKFLLSLELLVAPLPVAVGLVEIGLALLRASSDVVVGRRASEPSGPRVGLGPPVRPLHDVSDVFVKMRHVQIK